MSRLLNAVTGLLGSTLNVVDTTGRRVADALDGKDVGGHIGDAYLTFETKRHAVREPKTTTYKPTKAEVIAEAKKQGVTLKQSFLDS